MVVDEAFLVGGVEMEEKGERYRDGDKVSPLGSTADNDVETLSADELRRNGSTKRRWICTRKHTISTRRSMRHTTSECLLNRSERTHDLVRLPMLVLTIPYRARVLFTLSTSFQLPPESLSYLTTSIDLYRHSTTLTQDLILSLDAGYNLAQALLELAEVLGDLHTDRDAEIRNLLFEATEILGQVMDGQEGYLQRQKLDDIQALDPGDELADAVETSGIPPVSEEADQSMEVDTETSDTGGSGSSSAAYETHLPTASTYIDTCLLLLDTHLSLWTTADPPSIPSAEAQTVIRSILDRATASAPPGRQAEIDFGEIKVLLALDETVWSLHKSEASISGSTSSQASLEKATVALESLLSNVIIKLPDEPTVKAELVIRLAAVHQTISNRLVYCSSLQPHLGQTSPAGQKAWYHTGEAITHLTTALEMTTSANTPRTAKPSVLLGLSNVSLTRLRLATINDTARRNARQLLDNALNYAIKAAEAIGWGWVNPSSMESTAKRPSQKWQVELPYPAGWATELLARAIVLQLLRTCYYCAHGHGDQVMNLQPDMTARFDGLSLAIVERLQGLQGDRSITGVDISRWETELVADEEVLSEGEKAWWSGIRGSL